MKKSFVFITIIALLFSLIGCSTDNAPLTGSIKVSVNDSTSRTITSDVSPEAVKYMVEGTAPDGSPVSFELSESTPSWTNAEAAPGNWSFTATAYNADGKAIGDGSSSATVVPGQGTSVTIEVNEYSGTGNLTVNLTGLTSDRVRYTATIYNTTELVKSATFTEGKVTFTLPNGFYALVLSCDNASINMPAAEAVRIMKDDNLSVSYSICDHGGVEAVISNGIKPCPEMSITLSSESINVGEEVTAAVSITPGTYNYVWYVNDVMLESVNGNSVDITLEDEGGYKITCIAYDTETGVVWSQEATVNVITPRMNTVSFYSGNKLIETRECPAGSTQTFPTIELGEGFTLSGWKAEDSDDLITDESFSLPYSEEEYKYYADIDTELLRIDKTGAVYGTDSLKNSSTITEVVIPYSINGKAVTSIGYEAFYYKGTQLTKISIPDSVTSIKYGAFSDCSSLTEITIPNSVTSIGDGAFGGCSSLIGITIPDSVTSIGSSAFSYCSSLTSITIPDSVTSIGESAFKYCSSLTSINVSDNNKYYKSIDGVLFDKNAETIIAYPNGHGSEYVIPDSVTSIGVRAFKDCSSLTSITFPDSVTSIGEWAFSGCSSLTDINVSDNNKYYKSVDGILFDKNVQTIIVYPCGRSSNYYAIPNSVTSIGYGAFNRCSRLTGITIPDSVTSIGSAAFGGCSSLIGITIPDSVTSIGESAFSGCWRLTGITIPDSVTSIEDRAFAWCSSLTSINIKQNQQTTKLKGAPWDAPNATVNWDYTD
ncbi:MAG: leucine-rich repeat domain-containing protein [Spirochaetales bacterium]|nr:leucine-rich repeat domain-containing protein [Spirochaetales bacterium]